MGVGLPHRFQQQASLLDITVQAKDEPLETHKYKHTLETSGASSASSPDVSPICGDHGVEICQVALWIHNCLPAH